MDFNFWLVNWYLFYLSIVFLFIILLNLEKLGELKNIFLKLSVLFVLVSLIWCFYTYSTRHKIGAICEDGWNSESTGSGTCSHHGGVGKWKYKYWFNN